MRKILVPLILLLFSFSGCMAVKAHKGVMDEGGASQLQTRQAQTRYYDTDDKKKTLEAVLATLQDLGFVIDKAAYDAGTVSATKLAGYNMRMTVNVVPRPSGRMMVRASAQFNVQAVSDASFYQGFFDALSKSMFLQANLDE